MSKPKSQSVPQPGQGRMDGEERGRMPNKPLSGSKKVKNRNHSRQNHSSEG